MGKTSNKREKTMGKKKEVLIVASKLKKYLKEEKGMHTAGNVPEVLSDVVRGLVDLAVEKAKKNRRKTVKDRDFS